MFCTNCGTKNADDARFCFQCGSRLSNPPETGDALVGTEAGAPDIPKPTVARPPLSATCPGCGSALEIDSSFAGQTLQCPGCGAAILAPSPSAPTSIAVRAADDAAAVKAAVDRVFALFHDKDGTCVNATKEDAERVAKAAKGGDARAMALFGEILQDGCNGVDKDPKAAAAWFRKAAEAGDAWGMFEHGLLLSGENPDGVIEENVDEGLEWLRKARSLFAKQGEMSAMQLSTILSTAAQAKKRAGEDGTPDFGASAAMAVALLDSIGDARPETTPAVDRSAIGFSHYVLGYVAMGKGDAGSARGHFAKGAAFGDESSAKALAEIGGGEGSVAATADKSIPASPKKTGPRCKHCGHPVSVGTNPCPKCGHEIKWVKKVGYGPQTKASVSSLSPTVKRNETSGASSGARTSGPAKKNETKEYAAGMGFLWGLALVFSGVAWNKFSSFGSFDIAWQSTAFRVFLIGAAVFLVLIAIIGDVFMFKNGGTKELMEKSGTFLGVITIVWAVVFSLAVAIAVIVIVIVLFLAANQEKTCPRCGYKTTESRCPRCGQKLGGGLAGSYSFDNIPTYNGG